MQMLLDYLGKSSPTVLEEVRLRHPDQRRLLTSRTVLSGAPTKELEPLPDPDRTQALIELLQVGTNTMLSDLHALIPRVMRRLSNCNRAKVFGGIVSSVSGAAAAWLVHSGAGPAAATLSTAVLATCGGVCTLIAGQFERSPSGARVSLAGDIDKIISLRAEVERMRRRLDRHQVLPIDQKEAEKLIDQLDVVAETLVKLSYS